MTSTKSFLPYIRRLPLFQGLDEEQLAAVAAITVDRRYPAGHLVFYEGDPATALYFVAEGSVRMYKSFPDGREYTLAVLGAGQIFGGVTFLDGGPYPATAEVLDDAYVGVLKNTDLQTLANDMPGISWQMVMALARRLRRAQARSAELAVMDTHERLANTLLHLAKEQGTDQDGVSRLAMPLTHKQLADMIGASRETVTRAIQDLKRDKTITQEDETWFLDLERLALWCGK